MTETQDRAADTPQNRIYQAAPDVAAATEEFKAALSHMGFIPNSIERIAGLLTPLLGAVSAAYVQERHEQATALVSYFGGKLMDDFLPQPGELDRDGAYDVGFQGGVACAYLVVSAGAVSLEDVTNPERYKVVRQQLLAAAANGELRETLLGRQTEEDPE